MTNQDSKLDEFPTTPRDALPRSLKSRLVTGTFWSLSGNLVSRGLMILALLLCARILDVADYGALGIILTTVTMFRVFAGTAVSLTATRHVAQLRGENPARAGRVLALSNAFALGAGVIAAGAMIAIAPWMARSCLQAPHLAGLLQVAAVMIFFAVVNGALTGGLAGFEAFRSMAGVNLVVGLIAFPMILLGAYFWGLAGAVGGMTAMFVLRGLGNQLMMRREARAEGVPIMYRDALAEWRMLFAFSLPALLIGVLFSPLNLFAESRLACQPDGLVAMGVFTAAGQFRMVLLYLGGVIDPVLIPLLSSPEGSRNERFRAVNVVLSWMIAILPVLALICVPEILAWVVGDQYATPAAEQTLILIACFTALMLFRQGLLREVIARDKLWWAVPYPVFFGLVLVPAVLGLVQYGSVGLAGALLIAHVLTTVVTVCCYWCLGIIPPRTLVSVESASVWLIVGGAAFLSFQGAPLAARLSILACGTAVILFAFKRMFRISLDDLVRFAGWRRRNPSAA